MATAPLTVVGSYLSPYVRKVLVCLDLKGVDYRIDPIVPFFGDDRFTRLSPVRRIPVLIDGPLSLADSTVICEYLEEKHPLPSLLPGTCEERARARWLEEFADTRMGEVFIWRYFNELAIKRAVWKEESDPEVVRRALEVEIPEVLDYLEGELPGDGGFFFGEIGIADVAVASFFRNAAFVGFSVDAARWPAVAAFVERTLGQPSFAKLRRFEDALRRTPIDRQREALAEIGAPLSEETFGTATPRRGVLAI